MSSESKLIPYQAARSVGQGPALVLAPHPDDEVFGCAGAIVRHVAAGDPVTVIILTDGGGLQAAGQERDACVAKRRQESEAAAAILGYGKPHFWTYRDRELVYGEPLVRQLCEAVAAAGARWLYAPSPYELHPDHRYLGFAALETARRCAGRVTLAFYEIGAPLSPNCLLDITDLLERKRQAIACFVSQLAMQTYDRHIEALNCYRTYTLPREIEAAEAYWVIESNLLAEKIQSLYAMIAGRWQVTEVMAALPTQPLASVIVRAAGRPGLSEALGSIAVQTYPCIEVIVVDAIGAGLLRLNTDLYRFPLRVISVGHVLGRAAAANRGLDAAQGEYLIFLDDDSWFEPDHIAGLVESLEQDPARVAAYSGVRCVRRASGDNWETVQFYNEAFDETRLRLENYIPIHALLFRRKALNGAASCRFDERLDLYENWDFWLQLLEQGYFQHRETLSACDRIHAGGGLGVAADEQRALAALQVMVSKWRSRWSDRNLMDIIARARRAEALEICLATQQAETARIDQEWRTRYETVIRSRSWRWTAPLRRGMDWLRVQRVRTAATLDKLRRLLNPKQRVSA